MQMKNKFVDIFSTQSPKVTTWEAQEMWLHEFIRFKNAKWFIVEVGGMLNL